jgi:histidinol-phosphate aminotransferase
MSQPVLDSRLREPGESRRLIRLHLNEAPWGPPAAAVRRIRDAVERANIYPIGETKRAAEAAARHFGLSPRQVVLTTGVDEATDLCLLELGRLLTVRPGFNGFTDRAAALGLPARAFELPDYAAMPRALFEAVKPNDVVMVASPNNPTGQPFRDEDLLGVLGSGAYLFLDETYADFADGAPGLRWLDRFDRLIVFKSFSKSFALGGLRLGCMIGDARTLERFRSRQQYYPVDRLAVEGLIGALAEEPDFPERLAGRIRPLRDELTYQLGACGLFERILDSSTNFVLAICRSAAEAREIQRFLAERARILVASAEPFGLAEGLRITVGNERQIEILGRALNSLGRQLQEEGALVADRD